MKTNFVSRWLESLIARLKGIMWKMIYQHLAKSYRKEEWKFMNYGYASLDDPPETIPLEEADAENRYCIQLYHHVAGAVDLNGMAVLEVGSGRGGGADFVKRYLKPQKMVGVDYAKDSVIFSKRNCSTEGLSFEVGNAESLPFADDSFDAVINVESSHCYPSMEAFLGQVKRVLRKGGYFLFADLRSRETVDLLREQLKQSGLRLIKETNITPNVVRALEVDNERRTTFIKEMVNKSAVKAFLKFAGAQSSPINNKFRNGEVIYLSCILQKS